MNRKGVTAQIVTTFPVMVLTVLLMAIFVFLSISVFQIRAPEGKLPFLTIADSFEDSLLLEEVKYEGKSIFLVDLILLDAQGEINSQDTYSILEKLVYDGKNCLAISRAYGDKFRLSEHLTSGNSYYVKYEDGVIFRRNSIVRSPNPLSFQDGAFAEVTSFYDNGKGERLFVSYYYGECLEEKDE